MKEKLRQLFGLTSKAEETAGKLPDLLAEVDRVASTMMQGFHGRKKKGVGEAFWQYSEFFDQVHERRKIDWRRSAREDRLYVKENEWEASESVFLWRDNSPGMDWKGNSEKTKYTKKQTAEILMLALAKLLTNVDERVAMIGTSGTLSRKIDGLVGELSADLDTNPDAWKNLGQKGKPLPKDGFAVIFSDFFADPEEVQQAIGRLADRGVKGHLVQILDREEIDFPFEGNIRFEDLNTDDTVRIPKAEAIRREYKQELHKKHKELSDMARRIGWGYTVHITDEPLHDGLMPFYNGGQQMPNKEFKP